jgi:hypothetical protein
VLDLARSQSQKRHSPRTRCLTSVLPPAHASRLCRLEQINLQLASNDTVVVAFVTYSVDKVRVMSVNTSRLLLSMSNQTRRICSFAPRHVCQCILDLTEFDPMLGSLFRSLSFLTQHLSTFLHPLVA